MTAYGELGNDAMGKQCRRASLVGGEGRGEKGVGMEAGAAKGYGGEVKRERLTGEGLPLMLAA